MSELATASYKDGMAVWVHEVLAKGEEFQTISTLVAQPESSPGDVVLQIVNITRACTDDGEKLGNHLYHTACSLLELAARTPPEQQAKLIAFFHQLREVIIIDPEKGEPLRYDGVHLVWRDMPTFGYTFADELGSFDPLASSNTPEDAMRWENETAFFAQLSATSSDSDFSTWALTAFSYAFGPWEEQPGPSALAVRAACLWFIFAAEKLFVNVENDLHEDCSHEEWERWTQCLVEYQSRIADGRTITLISTALEQIKRVQARRI